MNEIRGGRRVRKLFLKDGVDKHTHTHTQEKIFTISHAVVCPTGTRTQSVFAYNVCVCLLKSKAFRRSVLQGAFKKIIGKRVLY
jgi:hypothetical protein